MKRFIELMPEEMFTWRRDAPKPVTFRFDAAPAPWELRMCRDVREREEVWARYKWRAAEQLAELIAKECQWFDAKSGIEGPRIRLEVTLYDTGQYENWLPHERRAGRREGRDETVKELTASLPHGLAGAATEFYE